MERCLFSEFIHFMWCLKLQYMHQFANYTSFCPYYLHKKKLSVNFSDLSPEFWLSSWAKMQTCMKHIYVDYTNINDATHFHDQWTNEGTRGFNRVSQKISIWNFLKTNPYVILGPVWTSWTYVVLSGPPWCKVVHMIQTGPQITYGFVLKKFQIDSFFDSL